MTVRSNPAIAAILMLATDVAAVVGITWGFWTVSSDEPSLTGAALVAGGLAGLLSFVRHSIFWRADAERMHWDTGHRNNFQIEVGLANLAWGLLAILAVVLHWGLVAEAASLLVFGFYLDFVAIMMVAAPRDAQHRPWGPLLGLAGFGVAMTILGFIGMSVA